MFRVLEEEVESVVIVLQYWVRGSQVLSEFWKYGWPLKGSLIMGVLKTGVQTSLCSTSEIRQSLSSKCELEVMNLFPSLSIINVLLSPQKCSNLGDGKIVVIGRSWKNLIKQSPVQKRSEFLVVGWVIMRVLGFVLTWNFKSLEIVKNLTNFLQSSQGILSSFFGLVAWNSSRSSISLFPLIYKFY